MFRQFDLTCSQCEKNERGTYIIAVRCSNCGASGIGVYSKGHESYSPELCPDCDCRTLRPSSRGPIVVGNVEEVLVKPGAPAPHELYAQTGGGQAYIDAMIEHGYVVKMEPTS